MAWFIRAKHLSAPIRRELRDQLNDIKQSLPKRRRPDKQTERGHSEEGEVQER